jgi:urease accessory protein
MLRATRILPASDERTNHAAATITLAREDRHRRRVAMTADDGTAFLLDLAEATYLPNGAGLLLEDGGVVRVRAADEPLLQITAPDALSLARLAWHIGNRHTPAEITAGAIYIQPDHVLAEMVRGLGGTVEAVARPFEPEGGAYGGHGPLERGHHHGHGPDHDHHHDHGDHDHAHHHHGHDH